LGINELSRKKETKTITGQSTTEGQQTPTLEPVLETEEGNKTPGNLETGNFEESLQNLGSSEARVAPMVAPDGDLKRQWIARYEASRIAL